MRTLTDGMVQLMAQGLPWMQLKSKPAGAHTLYVHKLSTPWQFTYFDALLSTEPAALLRRSCAPCAVPGRAGARGREFFDCSSLSSCTV